MMSPLVTVYVTNFNYGRFIKRAINSITAQTFTNFELIIIDDGSTDDSLAIIYELLKEVKAQLGEEKIKLIIQENRGLNRSSNVALNQAQGKYIIRLDADDYFDPRALEIMTATLEKNDELGIVFPDFYIVDETENIIQLYRRNDFKEKVSLYDRPAHGACTMIRIDFLKNFGGYNEDFSCQDGFDLWLKMISKHQIENINLPLFYYRNHNHNLTKNQEKIFTSRGKILKAYIQNEKNIKLRTIAVVPIRGTSLTHDFLPLVQIGEKELTKWTIDSALKCAAIDEIIITCASHELLNFLQSEYRYQKSKKIHWHIRTEILAGPNIDITDTIIEIDKTFECLNAEAYCLLYIESPFRDERYIEQAINTLSFYPVDCVDGVVNDTSFFYKHDGSGLVPINTRPFFQFERDDIFKRGGGIHIVKKSFLSKNKKLLEGITGHILIDERSAFTIRSQFDLEIAQKLANQNLDFALYSRNSNEDYIPMELN